MRFLLSGATAASCLFLLTGCPDFTKQQASCSLASTWTVVDEFRYDGDTEATGIATDGTGNVFVAGASTSAGRGTWLVRASGDQGGRWQYTDASNASIAEARPRAVVSSPYGVFVAGEVGNLGSAGWLTRRFASGAWANDDGANGTASGSGITALATDRDGTVLAAGYGGTNGDRWILRTRDPLSGGWYGFAVTGSESDVTDVGRARAVAASAGGWLVAGGDRVRTPGGNLAGRWIVRRSSDRGQTWSTADVVTGGLRTEARAAATATDGTVYVAGTIEDGHGRVRWVVRRSTNFGYTWETSDDFTPEGNVAQPNGIAIGGDGLVWVAGTMSTAQGTSWTVRRGGKGTPWTTMEHFLATGHSESAARGVAFGKDGAVFVAGRSTVTGQGVRWLVRKLPCLAASAVP